MLSQRIGGKSMGKTFSLNLSILALLSALAIAGCQSSSEVSHGPAKSAGGWLQYDAAMRQADKMRARNKLPVSIQCRVVGGTSSDPVRAVKVKWSSTDKAIRWTWAVGNDRDFANANAAAAANGLRIASKSRTIDERTNLPSVCAIWHSRPGK